MPGLRRMITVPDRDAEIEVAGEVQIARPRRRRAAPGTVRGSRMICIAPDLRRAGHRARRETRHERVEPIAIVSRAGPRRSTSRCITCEKRSSAHELRHAHRCRIRTTRPMSFRPRSTSITCSARSFSLRFSSLASRMIFFVVAGRADACPRWDASRRATLRRAPAFPATIRRSDTPPMRMKYMYGDGLTWRSAR